MKKLIVLVLILGMRVSFAQVFPIQVATQMTAPYSPYLSDLTAPGSQRMMVQVRANDISLNNYRCRFRITIEGPGITIRTHPNFSPQPTTLTGGGMPQIIYGSELTEYFLPRAMEFAGISRAEYEKSARLPEGVYRFSVEVLDYHRGTVVSNQGMTTVWIMMNDPPLLNQPQNHAVLEVRDPVNILFSWTPRHTASPNAAFTTEYIFRIVEIWPESRNPYDAFLTQPPLYETALRENQLLYGTAEPALIPGRKYAWQVEARDTEGRDLFKNNGRSEVFVFQFGEALAVPQNLGLRWAKPTTLAIRWDAVVDDREEVKYRLQYRPRRRMEDHRWHETRTKFTEKTLYHLQQNTEYEVRVRAEKIAQESDYTDVLVFQTLRQEPFSCDDEAEPPPAPANTLPVFPLSINDTLHAGGYDVLVRDVIEMDGRYYGSGVAVVPWFNSAKVRVTFENISVNDGFWLTRGTISSIRNSESEFLLEKEAPLSSENVPRAGELDLTIVAVDSLINVTGMSIAAVTKDEEGNIVITTTDGKEQVLPGGESYAVVDDVGNGYVVDEDGNIVKTTSTVATASAGRGDRDYEVGKLSFHFEKGQGKFGFDEKRYDALAAYYQQLADGSYVPWKALSSANPDLIDGVLQSEDKASHRITFESGSAPLSPTASSNGNFRLQLLGKTQGTEEELLALYAAADSLPVKVLAKVNLVTYNDRQLNLVIVPVNDVALPGQISAEMIAAYVNSVYGQAVISWQVRVENGITVELGDVFDDSETGVLSNYTGDMKKVLHAYGRLQDNTYYLFLIDKPANASTLGYMPRNKQAGFVFVSPHRGNSGELLKTIAHELGHGAFNLKHTFSEHALPPGTTDNVMDYSDGGALYKYQWDYIHEPEAVMGLFEGDEALAMQSEFAAFRSAFLNKVGAAYKDGRCLKEAIERGFEVGRRFDFDVATYAGFIRLMLCGTRRENCDQENYLQSFSCGFANALLQEVDWITMLESAEAWSIDPEKLLMCVLESFPVGGSHDDPELRDIVFKCLTGVTLGDLGDGLKDFVAHHWDQAYDQGQATAFALTLFTPFKGKILSKLEDLPTFAGKIDDLRSLSRAGTSRQVVEISHSLVNSAGKFTSKQIADYVKLASKNVHAEKVMLGSWDNGLPSSYIKRAGEDYTYFDMDDKWNEARKTIDNGVDEAWKLEMWKINKQFIDEQKALGKDFYFSHEPWRASEKTFLFREAEYLIDIGAEDFQKINDNTWKVIW